MTMSDIFEQPVPRGEALAPTSVVATVNGAGITAQDLERQTAALIASVRNRMPPEQLAQLAPRFRQQAMDQLVAKQLLLIEATTAGIVADPAELATQRAELEARLPEGMALTNLLEMRGINEEQFNREFEDEFRINKLIEARAKLQGDVGEADAKAFYDENPDQFKQPETVSARHVLVAFEPGATDEQKAEKKAKADAIREKLAGGADFAEVVMAESDDPGSKETGGLYTFPRGQMVPQFEEAAFTQTIGEVGAPVETRFGYHVIRVDERNEARTVPFVEVQSNIVQYLSMRNMQKSTQEYVEGLRSNATINILIGGGAAAE